MVDVWQRASLAFPAANPYWGGSNAILLFPGETVLRTWVNISVWGLWSAVNAYPPGNSLLRAGLIIDEAEASQDPTPVSQENEPWMWLSTLQPTVQLSRATNVAWHIVWSFPTDISVKAQRKNSSAVNQVIRLAWEFELSGQVDPFAVSGWNGSIDALIRDPDAAFQQEPNRVLRRAT